MTTSCTIYSLNSPINTNDLLEKLEDDYTHTRSHPQFNDDLKTDVVDVNETTRGVTCTVRYDQAKQRGARAGNSPWYIDVQNVRVRFTEEYFILLGDHSSSARSHISEILDYGPDGYSRVNISFGTIGRVVSADGSDELQGTWRNIDEHTDSATVSGEVDQSSVVHDIEANNADPGFRQFESQAYDNQTLGLSEKKDTVTFWGKAWDPEDYEDYIFQFVLPRTD